MHGVLTRVYILYLQLRINSAGWRALSSCSWLLEYSYAVATCHCSPNYLQEKEHNNVPLDSTDIERFNILQFTRFGIEMLLL